VLDLNTNSPQNREIALTGATGFIGAMILSQLIKAGWQVRALYRNKKGRKPQVISGVTWIAGDLNDNHALTSLVKDTFAVIHCAGVVRGASQEDFNSVNEQGTYQIAKVASSQPNSPRFLLLSSLAAREPNLSHYSASKWRGERVIKNIAGSLRWTVIRPPAVYGPGDRELLPLFQSIANGIAPIPAGANGRFSMIYVEDLASAIVSWLNTDSCHGQTLELDDQTLGGYNWDTVLAIGGKVLRNGSRVRRLPIPISVLKLIASVNLVASKILRYSPMLTPGKIREIIHADWVCNDNNFERLADWQPVFDLERGLETMFKHKIAEK